LGDYKGIIIVVNVRQSRVKYAQMARVKRILLEYTHTYETTLNTGIQRVVGNIVKESERVSKEIKVECVPVIFRHGCFLAADRMKNKPSLRARIRAFLKDAYRLLRPLLRKILPFPRLEKILLFQPGYLTAMVYTLLDVLTCPVLLAVYLHKRVIPHNGDLLLLLDSSWVYRIWPAVRHAKKNGMKVGLVVHDIFQVTHPHLFVPATAERFQVWLDQAMENVDFIIAVSKTTRNEVERYVESHSSSAKEIIKFESFRLGSVIDNVVSTDKVRNELKRIFELSDKQNTYLTVGTIEPRKNHKYLLDAFEKVWQRCPHAKLCIVGRIGWFCDGLEKRIKSHLEYKKYLFMFNDLSDTELDYCYKHSKALIFPSLTEGFGLPLVEALYKGLPVLASDIPIFREVGRDFCAYFDLSQSASLAKIIIDIEENGEMPEVREPAKYQLPDWEDSCRELISKAVALYEKVSD
jgi:O-antigen biosynthesis alpha-1,2-rhamnosyltransferase